MTITKIIDTKQLQKDELVKFMRGLFFTPVDEENLGRGFKYMDMTSWKTEKYIGFSDACKLFNNTYVRLHKSYTAALGLNNQSIEINYVRVALALHRKLIESVKLQRCKSEQDGVKCQGYMVKLTDQGERDLKGMFYAD